jgi:hypothetical protein
MNTNLHESTRIFSNRNKSLVFVTTCEIYFGPNRVEFIRVDSCRFVKIRVLSPR